MKLAATLLTLLIFSASAVKLQSQAQPRASAGLLLLQVKTSNEALITRQKATLEILKQMETDSNQMRIVAKRG